MKILFILGAYKPRASANGLCSSNIIEHLKNEGHAVTVLANHNIGCSEYAVEDGISVYRVKPRMYMRLKEYAEVYSKTKRVKCRIVSFLASLLNKLQLFLTAPSWPLISRQTIKRFAKKARELQKEKNFDAVIAVYTPIESLLAGYEVKKEFPQVKFIPYFLDSLSGGYGPRAFSKEEIIKRGLKIEKDIYDAADAVVLMKSSEEHQKKYNEKNINKMIFLDIPMLVRPEIVCEKRPCTSVSKQCKMLFVGSVSRNVRNPETLIKALMCLYREDIVCEFIGNIDCIDDFAPLKEKMGERLIFSGFMNHDKLAEKISGADILINIGNLLPTMVPSKIFEYMSFSKPIISTYDIENEPSAKYLREYPAALLISGQALPEENASRISEFINGVDSMKIDLDLIEEQFYLNTPRAFDEVIGRIIEE